MSGIPPAPFGARVKRFLPVGYHPGLNAFPGTLNYANLCPGCYNINNNKKIICKIPRWDQCLKDEEFSRRLAYKNEHILKERLWKKSVNGPGWQDISESLTIKGGTFRKSSRFPSLNKKKFAPPGPGTYGKNHVPHTRMEEKSRMKGFSHCKFSFFERMSGRSSLDFQLSYHLPPNLYKIKSSIDELIAKKVSKRGPYDLFTGPRFEKIVPSKYAERPKIKFNQSDLAHPKNAFKGKFLKCGKDDIITSRFVIINPASSQLLSMNPGPNYYDPYPTAIVTQSFHPFNSSSFESRFILKNEDIPPPGRYNIETKKCIKGEGFRSDFISKTKRDFYKVEKFSWFE